MSGETERSPTADWPEVFDHLVAAHHNDMLRLAYGMTGNSALAADVVQAAWAAAWTHRNDLREASKVRGWLLTITANQARKSLRWRSLRRWLPLVDADSAVGHDEHREERLDLLNVLQGLPPRDRQILLLRYALGEPSAEIGRQVGLSESGVRVRLSRLLDRMRKELGDE